MKYFYPCWIFFAVSSLPIFAQDVHFSQFDNTPIFTHAGQTGQFNGDYRFGANYRNQWFSVPVPYTTYAVSAEARLFADKLEKDVCGIGLQVIQDKAGDSQLSTSIARLSVGYSKRLAEKFFLFAGANLGFGQRRFKTDKLTFDDQWQGDRFNAGIQSADLGNLQNTAFMYPDVGGGLGLRFQESARTFLNVGLNAQYLNRPKQSFMGTNARLSPKYGFYLSGSAKMGQRLDWLASGQLLKQHVYYSVMLSTGFRYHLNQNPGRETAIAFLTQTRLGDAFVPTFVLSYQTWQFGLSYDINTSKFRTATNRNGAIELSLIYIFRKIPRLPVVKICPIL
jgi:type IX secretion system PorP/SprF family membrane protein